MGDQTTYFKQAFGDRFFRDWLRGMMELFEGCIISGAAISDGGGLVIDIASGFLYLGKVAVDFNGDSYTLADDDTSFIYAELTVTRDTDPTSTTFGKATGFSFDFVANIVDAPTGADDEFSMKVAEVLTAAGAINTITTIDRSPMLVSGSDFRVKLGDAGGSNKFSIVDSTGAEIFNIDSDGNMIGGGWHGSEDRIKLVSKDFQADNPANPEYKTTPANSGVTTAGATDALWATVPIPTGYKATAVRVYASVLLVVSTHEADLTDGTSVAKGAGDTTAEIDITDVPSTSVNVLEIGVVNVNTETIFGGYVTIAKI